VPHGDHTTTSTTRTAMPPTTSTGTSTEHLSSYLEEQTLH
jgi:hypothetical protein